MFWILLVVVSLSFAIFILWPCLVYFVFRIFLCKRDDLKKAGEWVIITGSTDGIGKAFAELLAKDGLNIFLISRSKTKLEEVASELEKEYNVKTKIFVADLAKEDFSYDELKSEIEGLTSISCLVNNAGISYTYPDAFCSGPQFTLEFCQDMITINTVALTKLIRLVLPKMINDPLPVAGVKRFIINMASISGVFTVPYLSLYGATKAYIVSFTRALAYELKDTCVRMQAFTPSLVATNMSGIKRTSGFIPSPRTYAKSALSMLGTGTVGCGYFRHAFFLHLSSLFPSSFISSHVAKSLLRNRDRYLLKQKQR